jgi:hypothetical protein
MNQQPSAWDRATIAWDRFINSMDQHPKGWAESTSRFSNEESLHCHRCGTWVEPVLAHISCYTGEPLCLGCAESEEADA